MSKQTKSDARFRRFERAKKTAAEVSADPAASYALQNLAREFLGAVERHPGCKHCKQVEATASMCNMKCVKASKK